MSHSNIQGVYNDHQGFEDGNGNGIENDGNVKDNYIDEISKLYWTVAILWFLSHLVVGDNSTKGDKAPCTFHPWL